MISIFHLHNFVARYCVFFWVVGLASQNENAQSNAITRHNWLNRQIRLLARFGPQLFHYEPSTYTALLLQPQLLQSSKKAFVISDGLSKWISISTSPQASQLLSLLLPTLISCIVDTPSQLSDLHRCEALKLLERLLMELSKRSISGTKSSKMILVFHIQTHSLFFFDVASLYSIFY